MAKLYVDTIEPEGATTNLAIGESGQDVIVTGNDIRANVLQDAGGGYAIESYTSTGTISWTAPTGVTDVQYLVVGGGGGGGYDAGGGGGAGGYRTGTLSVTAGNNYTLTVGAGGIGGTSSPRDTDMDGADSVFSSITSSGGGSGANYAMDVPSGYAYGIAGGSGGGGGGYTTGAGGNNGGAGNAGSYSPVEGYAGGANAVNTTSASGGGGGGSSSVGQTAQSGGPASGGSGTSNSITGTAVTYAAGGVGETDGGNSGTAGGANTGDGGGGGGNPNTGNAGGSGIVVLKYTPAAPSAIFTSNGSGTLSGLNSAFGDALVLISTTSFSGQTSIEITSNIDNTYSEYIFRLVNFVSDTANSLFVFQCSIDGGSNYNLTTTSTFFLARHTETNSTAQLGATTAYMQNQGTSFQNISYDTKNDADAAHSGELHLFNPSSTTFVKNWYYRAQEMIHNGTGGTASNFVAGYWDTTSAVNAIKFQLAGSGDIAGTVKMYGVK